MTNKTHFSPASEKGHFDGLVDEGKYLRQSSLYKQILPRTPIWIKTSVFSVPSLAKNLFNLRNLWLINDLRLRILTYEKINLFLQNEPKFRKSQMNVSKVLAMDYGKVDTWWSGKNKANSKPIQSQYKPNTNPIQTQNKPNTNPIQTQNKPNTNPKQTQYKPNSNPNKANFNRPAYTAGNCFEYSMRTGKNKKARRYLRIKLYDNFLE